MQQGDLVSGHVKGLRQEGHQRRIGLAIDRGSRQADFEGLAMPAGKFIAAGTRLDLHAQDQSVTLPVKAAGFNGRG